MVNTHLLRYYIAINNDTMEKLAECLDISRSALSAKINNKREFTIKEAVMISKRYKLCCDKCVEIFGEGD